MDQQLRSDFSKLYIPPKDSHKGQNGRLLLIGGSTLFHAASLWALEVASRIVDLVHYASVEVNNRLVESIKRDFRNGIVVPRAHIEDYVEEDDCVLIGPGMIRAQSADIKNQKSKIKNLRELETLKNEGVQTYYLTKYLLQKYPQKRWVIDAGALQMMELEWILKGAVLTPHKGEFERLKSKIQNPKFKMKIQSAKIEEQVKMFAKEYNCVVLLKGVEDIISDGEGVEIVRGGNAGMTKGGTGDVLSGLVAALYCKNDPFVSACAASTINKRAGECLYASVGYYFNASDLARQIPVVMKELVGV